LIKRFSAKTSPRLKTFKCREVFLLALTTVSVYNYQQPSGFLTSS
jgi:hypothetical protein